MTTAAQIRAALVSVGGLGGQGWTLDTIAAGADDAMRQAGITTREGAACLVAQCMVESAYFRTTREYGGSKTRYAPYYGRGFIQVTWRSNYAAFGAWCKARGLVPDADYFVNVPDRLADPKWAWLGAVWYFTTHRHGLVALANRGENIKVGRAINRGDAYSRYAAYGEAHRVAAYQALLAAGITPPGKATAPATPAKAQPADRATWLRKKIATHGIWSPGTIRRLQAEVDVPIDGVAGPQTKKAVQKWLGVTQDGVWGPQTYSALQRKLGIKQTGVWSAYLRRRLQVHLNRLAKDRA